MKSPTKLIWAAGLAMMVCGMPAAEAAQRNMNSRCLFYLPELVLSGKLDPQREEVVFQWQTTCVSTFSATANGGAQVYVQKLSNGSWQNLSGGATAYVPSLGSGSYRIVARNPTLRFIDYSVRHRRGAG